LDVNAKKYRGTPAGRFAATVLLLGLAVNPHAGAPRLHQTEYGLDLLTARGVALLARPSAPLAAALRTTDAVCRGWAPGVPVRLFQIVKDEQAANTDAARCVAELRAGGTGPSLITFRKGRYHGSAHLSSNVQGTAATVRWFAGT
jgi:hypothetical protein